MTGPVTVIGLVQGGCHLEDIRTTVPHRIAIQIPAHLAERSQSLVEALQQRQVMRLGSATVVAKDLPSTQLNTSLRGRGIAPQVTGGGPRPEIAMPSPSDEREMLVLELEASRAECRRLQVLNESLQSNINTMVQQLGVIQRTLEALALRQGPLSPPPFSGGLPQSDVGIPRYIPSTTLEAAEVRITAAESTSTSNVDEAVAALRTLRGKLG